jgi:hypothetical protein
MENVFIGVNPTLAFKARLKRCATAPTDAVAHRRPR